jgi:hypothetical protein
MKVSNLLGRTGRPIANQFIISTDEADYFQSYDVIVAKVYRGYGGGTVLDRNYWNYSQTTSKYLNQFLGLPAGEAKRLIATEEYILADLNAEDQK